MTESSGALKPFKNSEFIIIPGPEYASSYTIKFSFSSCGLTTVLISKLYFLAKSKSLWSWPGHPNTAPKP